MSKQNKSRFTRAAHSNFVRVSIAGGHAHFLFHDSEIPFENEGEEPPAENDAEIALVSKCGEAVRILDEGEGAFSLAFSRKARFYGLGAVAETADRRGGPFRMVTVDTQIYRLKGSNYSTFPILWARIPVDEKRQTHFCFVLASSFPYEVTCFDSRVLFRPLADMEGEGADMVVIEGEPSEIGHALARLTGMPAMPPAWALGYHQSRWSYKNEDAVLAVAQGLREHDLPADAIHLDIHYMHDYRVFTWHPQRFPHPALMHRALNDLKLRTVAIVDPGVAAQPSDQTYREMAEKGFFLKQGSGDTYVGKVWPGPSVFPDFLRPEVRAYWAERHRVLLNAGVSGIWNDMNEPTLHNTRYIDPTTTDLHHHEGTHTRMRNLYANRMAQAAYEGQRLVRPDKRPFVLSRSGFMGIQRHAALWTGDNFSHWQQLRANLYMVLNLALCGVPLSGADVGGFGSMRGPLGLFKLRRPPSELFIRWMELGSFMPFFRGHNTQYSRSQEPWSFGRATLRLVREQLRRRYRMLPTIYAIARQAAELGAPIVRPSWYQGDYGQISPDDAFFLGEDVLIFPVLEPGKRKLEVMLPEALFINGDSFEEARGTHVADAPLGTIPHFVRADAILATSKGAICAADTLKGTVYLDVYAAQTNVERRLHLVLDDGETELHAQSYRSIEATITHRSDAQGSALRFDWKRRDWRERDKASVVVRIRGTFREALCDGRPLPFHVEKRGVHHLPWTIATVSQDATTLQFMC